MPEPEKYLPMNRAELIARCEALDAALCEEVACYHAIDEDYKRDYARAYKAHKASKALLGLAQETPAIDPLLGDIDVFGVRGLTSETPVKLCDCESLCRESNSAWKCRPGEVCKLTTDSQAKIKGDDNG